MEGLAGKRPHRGVDRREKPEQSSPENGAGELGTQGPEGGRGRESLARIVPEEKQRQCFREDAGKLPVEIPPAWLLGRVLGDRNQLDNPSFGPLKCYQAIIISSKY